MKKKFFFMAAAAIALASCSSEDVVEVNNGNAIDFRVTMGAETNSRGAETNTDNLGQFYVTAISNNALYFENVLFSKGDDNKYKSAIEYLWPGTGTVDFYAYSYFAGITDNALNALVSSNFGTVSVTSTSQTITGFTPNTDVAKQIDLVTATGTGSNANKEAGLALTFKHALSQIQIKAKNGNTNYKYEVVGVKIGNVANTGTFTFKPAEGVEPWASQSGNTTYEVTYTTAKELNATAVDIMDNVGNANAMLVPQQLTAWEPSSKAITSGSYLAVKLKITMVGTRNVIYPKPAEGATEQYAYAYIGIDTKWDAGYRYIYTLDFTNGAGFDEGGDPILGGPIAFTADVTGWVDYKKEGNEKTGIDVEM